MRNSVLLAAATLLVAGCRREAPAPKAASDTLEAPAPSSAVVTSPLFKNPGGYDNEKLAHHLQNEAERLGIRKFGKSTEPEQDDERPSISYEEGLERTRAMSKQFASQRRALDRDKEKTVRLPGVTPELLPKERPNGEPVKSE